MIQGLFFRRISRRLAEVEVLVKNTIVLKDLH